MASTYQTRAQGPQWSAVSEQLLGMVRMLEGGATRPLHLIKFAEAYAKLARLYLAAIASEGRTSIRAESVVKALDLATPKSQLEAFLGREQHGDPTDA